MDFMQHKKFDEIDINDPFFEGLICDYPGFEDWFKRKKNDTAVVVYNTTTKLLEGFLYMKDEDEESHDIMPVLEKNVG